MDFGQKKDLFNFIQHHVDGELRQSLESLIKSSGGADSVKIEYKDYDWSVNST